MFVLLVKTKMKAGQAAAAEKIFTGPFKSAITAQAGFHDVQFLRPADEGDYVLSIVFEDQSFQQQWVETDIHAEVWSQMEQHFESYSVSAFNTV